MQAPATIEEIWQRKERARRRFAELPLAEQIEQMNRHRRELDQGLRASPMIADSESALEEAWAER